MSEADFFGFVYILLKFSGSVGVMELKHPLTNGHDWCCHQFSSMIGLSVKIKIDVFIQFHFQGESFSFI